MKQINSLTIVFAVVLILPFSSVTAGTLLYGDKDVLGTGTYSMEPTTGATLEGLAADAVTYSSLITPHGFPFTPEADDFAGTDQIYVGSVQTGYHDGYSSSSRLHGPQEFELDYSSLIPAGQQVATLTLGIAADDFQYPPFGQPFIATVNGVNAPVLTSVLNSLNQTGPRVQFFSIGIDTGLLTSDNILQITINQLGDGGDGWAVDFLTVGVTTIPEPATLSLLALGAMSLLRRRK
jgi:hypothetical protein